MLILGIDPGTRITGYGLLKVHQAQFQHVDNGCIIPPAKATMVERLTTIYNAIEAIIGQFQPDVIALERAFFGKNAESALKLGQCRGLVLVAAGRAGLKVAEFMPTEVKKAVTGSGRAEKSQIQKMVRLRLKMPEIAQADAADALAVALCHAQSYHLVQQTRHGVGLSR